MGCVRSEFDSRQPDKEHIMAKQHHKKESAVLNDIANFVYEAGNLSQTPRSGFWLLGSGKQSVAEHLFRTAMIAYALAYLTPEADRSKVILMALVHDFAEGRTADLNYVHQRYGRLAEQHALGDLAATVPFGDEMKSLYEEEQARETLEARLVKDADQLEWIASMREEEIKGNIKAGVWANIALKRLKTPVGKKLAKVIMKTHPDDWWFNEDDQWFIDRKESDKHWRSGKKK